MHAPPTREQAVLTRARLLDQHPQQFDNRIYVDRAFKQLDADEPASAARENAERIRQLTGCSSNGAHASFFLKCPTWIGSKRRDQ